MPVGAPRYGIQVSNQGLLPAESEPGADRARLSSSLLQRKRDRTAMQRLPVHSLGG